MSLFYKNKPPQDNLYPNLNLNEASVVRPYDQPAIKTTNTSKMIMGEPRYGNDPTLPSAPASPSQQQQFFGLRKSYLIGNREDQKQSWVSKCCSCAKLQTFKKYYQVTNHDVLKRMLMGLQFWKNTFFGPQENYDFYGPFWIYTTVIFCLSAVPNILLYQGSQNFQYNFQIVGLAFGFIYLEGFLFPVIISFMLNLMGVNCTYIQNICIYGYSMMVVIICLLLCSINICILHFVLLGYAFVTKALFIMNNFNAGYAIPIAKKALIMGLIIGEAALQFFVIKFFFISCVPTQSSNSNTNQNHMMEYWFHSRTFNI